MNMGGLHLDTNQLNTSHSQRLNSGKPLGNGWWCPIDLCPNEPLPWISVYLFNILFKSFLINNVYACIMCWMVERQYSVTRCF